MLVALGIFGASLFYGDGMITPAISVLSAVEGIEVVAPGLDHLVVPLTLVILTVLFAMRDGASAVRFERRPETWDVLFWLEGEWQPSEPMKEEAGVEHTVRGLARPPGLAGVWAAVFGGGGEFGFRLAFGAEVRCAVGELRRGKSVTLLLRGEGDSVDRATELLDEYLRLLPP